jgi:hypothetical protein
METELSAVPTSGSMCRALCFCAELPTSAHSTGTLLSGNTCSTTQKGTLRWVSPTQLSLMTDGLSPISMTTISAVATDQQSTNERLTKQPPELGGTRPPSRTDKYLCRQRQGRLIASSQTLTAGASPLLRRHRHNERLFDYLQLLALSRPQLRPR